MLNLPVDKAYSIVALRMWTFMLFTVIHIHFTEKKSITERVFVLVKKWAVNITNFIREELSFLSSMYFTAYR